MYNQNSKGHECNCGRPPMGCQPEHKHEHHKRCEHHNPCQCNFPLAISYVPFQMWGETFRPDVALAKGTIFKELDLPFTGRG